MPAVRLFLLIGAVASGAFAGGDLPIYVSRVPNIHDYSLFANSGWDGNWYVGYNTCWILRLPPIPAGNYERAYIGAKLGRMKLSAEGQQPVPGTIYIAISSTAAWSKERSFLLTTTRQIPLEGDYQAAVEGTGEAQWFWTEIPLKDVNFNGDNYLALWSPTSALQSVSSSPVLAAAWGGKDQHTWLTRDIKGAPPRTPGEIGTPISYFMPAIAMKLILKGPPHPLVVKVAGWTPGTPHRPRPVVTARIEGEGIESVWLEFTAADGSWHPASRPLWKPPYLLTLDQTQLPPGRVRLRVAARNIWEEEAVSPPFIVEVATTVVKS